VIEDRGNPPDGRRLDELACYYDPAPPDIARSQHAFLLPGAPGDHVIIEIRAFGEKRRPQLEPNLAQIRIARNGVPLPSLARGGGACSEEKV
jgi:hypothetical protein